MRLSRASVAAALAGAPSSSRLVLSRQALPACSGAASVLRARPRAGPHVAARRGLSTPSFPCVDANEARTARLLAQGPSLQPASATPSAVDSGPEPMYGAPRGYKTFACEESMALDYGGELPRFDIAYETWGTLSPNADNAILLHTGLSASSHAASTEAHPTPGWWEPFIGPGKPLDTDRYFVICTNVLGGCYGSTGPSSPHPLDPAGRPYASRFPILTLFDMLRAQFRLLDHLGIQKLYASVGSSMGGMQSVAACHMHPDRVARVVSISGCARSAPASIALRYAQRSGELFGAQCCTAQRGPC